MVGNESTVVKPSWPNDVTDFDTKHGVQELLPKLLEITQRLFPSSPRVDVILAEDPEFADWRSIVFAVNAKGLSVAEAVERQRRWTEEMLDCYPHPRSCPFVLGLKLVE